MSEKEDNGNKILFFSFILFLGKTMEFLHGETKLIFWSTGKTTKKLGSVGRQNENIIWFWGSVFFKKWYFA